MNNYLAVLLRWYMRDNRDLTDFTFFENKIKALTPEAVNAAMRKYFDKSKLVMVYAGDFEKGKSDKPENKKGF
jgi:zinc protease